MSDNHEKYLMVSSVKELFDSVDNQSIIGFITEAHFYRTTAMLSAVYAVVVCVCVSVTLQYCIKTAKRSFTQITPHDSPLTLVF